MAKEKIVFECSECGEKHPKWQGKCNGCGLWNSLIETVEQQISKPSVNNRFNALNQQSAIVTLDQITAQDVRRQNTGIGELDRVLGGGLASGSVILLG
ncbi:MAG: DNA repair protein RadA, partial [Proteobacteria bacterium]